MSSLEPDNLLTVEFNGNALALNAGATNSVVRCWVSAVTFGRQRSHGRDRTAVIAIGDIGKGCSVGPSLGGPRRMKFLKLSLQFPCE